MHPEFALPHLIALYRVFFTIPAEFPGYIGAKLPVMPIARSMSSSNLTSKGISTERRLVRAVLPW
ncbi:hypothetical protein BDV29DRAFT_174650 [Aspergillus leporis]|uniref:Uncharacterized protein n=1 Tax=Aspergillus leporis TaxID=41062 RepID=A0A5N5WZD3_9EURO|nr:hypothetical protein BDV29DRAFT_174650 [Aspergillus leporis]